MSPTEQLEKKRKTTLSFRHKLQVIFLSEGYTPQAENMKLADRILTLLEGYVELEVDIIVYTRIHKVMRGI